MQVMPQGKSWVYTAFNLTVALIKSLQDLIVTCHIAVREICPDTQREHIQGYFILKKNLTLRQLKALTDNSIHFELRAGSHEQAWDYCCKTLPAGDQSPDDRILILVRKQAPAGQGRRTDLEAACDLIKSGSRLCDVADLHPVTFVKYYRGLGALRSVHMPAGDRPVQCFYLYGATGTGKSYAAWHSDSREDIYSLGRPSANGTVWFDGYEGQRTLLLDEFRDHWMAYDILLKILDKYPLTLQTKGGTTYARWDRVILTTNQLMDHCYPREDKDPLYRRFSDGSDNITNRNREFRIEGRDPAGDYLYSQHGVFGLTFTGRRPLPWDRVPGWIPYPGGAGDGPVVPDPDNEGDDPAGSAEVAAICAVGALPAGGAPGAPPLPGNPGDVSDVAAPPGRSGTPRLIAVPDLSGDGGPPSPAYTVLAAGTPEI